jgi:pimeloyl-ACP methyl ester carboxylesterase
MTRYSEIVTAGDVSIGSGKTVPPEINAAPFRAGDPGLPGDERLAALRLAFFAPGHDASVWLSGWYPETLRMQRTAASASGSATGGAAGSARSQVSRYWNAGAVPIFQIIAEFDPFLPKDQWGQLRSELGPRVTSTVIKDASHALFPEQPVAVAAAVTGYLGTLA